MLDFYLGTGGIEKPGEHIGSLSADAIYWLQKNGFLVQGTTGHLPEDVPESFPIGDDVVLNHKLVLRVYKKFDSRLSVVKKTSGFNSTEVNTMAEILELAIKSEGGLSTIAD